jgi:c-di-GMP-binding flagellar brake protein YcgR
MPVDYTVGEKRSRCIASSLGGGGLFLTQIDQLEPGTKISVRFRPARRLPIIHARASVRYVVAGQGLAIEFTEIRPEDRQRLLRLILQKTGDRRLHGRAPLATQVVCEECMALAFSREISPGGMFIETTAAFPEGTLLTVRFNLVNPDRAITAVAQVVYHIEKMGLGVLFKEIDPDDREAIEAYVGSAETALRSASAAN